MLFKVSKVVAFCHSRNNTDKMDTLVSPMVASPLLWGPVPVQKSPSPVPRFTVRLAHAVQR